MARPCANTDATPARQRITDAFFALLSEGGYSDVTARTLASRAHVSPNTIYYHFDCIFDVARCAVEEELSSELALFLISPEWKDSSALASLLSDPSNAKRFERIRLVAASENAQLTTLLTEAVKGKWLDAVGVDEESMSVEQSQDLRFIFRGAIDLLASLESGSDLAALPTFFDRPLGMGVRETLMNLMLEDRALS